MSDNTNKGELFMKIDKLAAERDTLKQQNAELAGQVEAMKQACLDWENTETPNAWQLIFDEIKRCANAESAQCLLEVKAEAGRAGFIAGWVSWSAKGDVSIKSEQYANKIRGVE